MISLDEMSIIVKKTAGVMGYDSDCYWYSGDNWEVAYVAIVTRTGRPMLMVQFGTGEYPALSEVRKLDMLKRYNGATGFTSTMSLGADYDIANAKTAVRRAIRLVEQNVMLSID